MSIELMFYLLCVTAVTSITLNVAQYVIMKDENRDRYAHYHTDYKVS
jgi:hypothetical protein